MRESSAGTRRSSSKRDKDLPELTDEMLARAVLKRGGKPVGRPPIENSTVAISLRLPTKVVARWRASGAGWQTRMAKVLERRAPKLWFSAGRFEQDGSCLELVLSSARKWLIVR